MNERKAGDCEKTVTVGYDPLDLSVLGLGRDELLVMKTGYFRPALWKTTFQQYTFGGIRREKLLSRANAIPTSGMSYIKVVPLYVTSSISLCCQDPKE